VPMQILRIVLELGDVDEIRECQCEDYCLEVMQVRVLLVTEWPREDFDEQLEE
jgi:hypothetical protein